MIALQDYQMWYNIQVEINNVEGYNGQNIFVLGIRATTVYDAYIQATLFCSEKKMLIKTLTLL